MKILATALVALGIIVLPATYAEARDHHHHRWHHHHRDYRPHHHGWHRHEGWRHGHRHHRWHSKPHFSHA